MQFSQEFVKVVRICILCGNEDSGFMPHHIVIRRCAMVSNCEHMYYEVHSLRMIKLEEQNSTCG